jgi:predicted  nucleic acid-binding Zn-ribbon protein
MEENNNYFNEAREQLDKWVHDQELAAQSELDNIKKQIRETTRLSRQATSLDEQYKLQEQIARLEKRKRKMRQKIFDVEDEIAEKRDLLIERLERRMSQKTKHQELFRIRWKVV